MTPEKEAFLYLSKAHDQLAFANDARLTGNHGGAVSMAFYAVFYAARGVLAFLLEEPKSHGGARSRFHLRAVHESDFPPEVAAIWDELREDRWKADYDIWAMDLWDDRAASQAIAKAKTFVDEANGWFDRHGPGGPTAD